MPRPSVLFLALAAGARAAAPPGPGPFGLEIIDQPVPGAPRGVDPSTRDTGKQCNVEDYGAKGDSLTNNTLAIQAALDDCGGRPEGGTVLLSGGGTFLSNPLWLRSNLTLFIGTGTTLMALGKSFYTLHGK